MRTGDTPADERRQLVRHPPDLLITTPESLYLMLTSAARETLRGRRGGDHRRDPRAGRHQAGRHLSLTLERLEHWVRSAGARAAAHRPVGHPAPPRGDRPVPRRLRAAARPARSPSSTPACARRSRSRSSSRSTTWASWARSSTSPPRVPRPPAPPARTIWPAMHPRLLELVREHRVDAHLRQRPPPGRAAGHPASTSCTGRASRRGGEQDGRPPDAAVSWSRPTTARCRRERRLADRGRAQVRAPEGPRGHLAASSSASTWARSTSSSRSSRPARCPPASSASAGPATRSASRAAASSSPSTAATCSRRRWSSSGCRRAQIEQTRYPRNPLDVLAQHIVAMCALDEWKVDELAALVRRRRPSPSCPTRSCPRCSTCSPAATRPRSSPSCAPASCGTASRASSGAASGAAAPRGHQRRHHPRPRPLRRFLPDGTRVGELDEEMVYEIRARARPSCSAPPRGGSRRSPSSGSSSPRRRASPGRCRSGTATAPADRSSWAGPWARSPASCEVRPAGATIRRPGCGPAASTSGPPPTSSPTSTSRPRPPGRCPTTAPSSSSASATRSATGGSACCRPFGAQVHAPWAMALQHRLAERWGMAVELMWSDDGIAIRLPESVEELPRRGAPHRSRRDQRDPDGPAAGHRAVRVALPRVRRSRAAPAQAPPRPAHAAVAAAAALRRPPGGGRQVPDLPDPARGDARVLQRRLRRARAAGGAARPPQPQGAARLGRHPPGLAVRAVAAVRLDRRVHVRGRRAAGRAARRGPRPGPRSAARPARGRGAARARRPRRAGRPRARAAAAGRRSPGPRPRRAPRPAPPPRSAHRRRAGGARRGHPGRRRGLGEPARRRAPGVRRARGGGGSGRRRRGRRPPARRPRRRRTRRAAPRLHRVGARAARGPRRPLRPHPWPVPHPARRRALRRRHARGAGGPRGARAPGPGGARASSGPRASSGSGATTRCCASCAAARSPRCAARSSPSTPPRWPGSSPGGTGSDRRGEGPTPLVEVVAQLQGAPLVASALDRDVLAARLAQHDPADLDALCTAGEVVWVGAGAIGSSDGRIRLAFRDQAAVLLPDGRRARAARGRPRRAARPPRGARRIVLGRPHPRRSGGRRALRRPDRPGRPVGPGVGGPGHQRLPGPAAGLRRRGRPSVGAPRGGGGTRSATPRAPGPARSARRRRPVVAGGAAARAAAHRHRSRPRPRPPAPRALRRAHPRGRARRGRRRRLRRRVPGAQGARGARPGASRLLRGRARCRPVRRPRCRGPAAGRARPRHRLRRSRPTTRSRSSSPPRTRRSPSAPPCPGRPPRAARPGPPARWSCWPPASRSPTSSGALTGCCASPTASRISRWARALGALVDRGRFRTLELRTIDGVAVHEADADLRATLEHAGFHPAYKGWTRRAARG